MTTPGPFDHFVETVRRFEDAVLAQQPVSAEHYDDAYFADDWREGGNRYDLDTRREIEGRNPALIEEVFAPDRVLDLGCGPGFLMALLLERGVEAEGVSAGPGDLVRPGAVVGVGREITCTDSRS